MAEPLTCGDFAQMLLEAYAVRGWSPVITANQGWKARARPGQIADVVAIKPGHHAVTGRLRIA